MKIGFLAISGVRVIDPELHRIGLNLPGFIERSKVIASLPSLGLITLAALTPEVHECHYLEVPSVDMLLSGNVELETFDVVAISSFTALIFDAYRLADAYRKTGTTVVLGGLHVTLCPEEAAQHADAIVVGEGESSWPRLISDLSRGRLEKRYHSADAYPLDQAPIPRFDLLEMDRYNRLTVQTTRGCPWHCEFCAASIRLNPRYRAKPVGQVMAELEAIRERWAAPFIEFADDNTFADRRHGHELMEAMAGEGIRWFTETDISVANDAELLSKMRKAGCAQILVGLEDPGKGTEGLELRSNWKAKQSQHYLDSVKRIQDAGITVNGCFVLGLDHQDEGIFERIAEFVTESQLYEVQLTVLTPFPGTPLYRRLEQEGRLTHPGDWSRCTLFDINYKPLHMTEEALHAGLLNLAQNVYSREATDRRRRGFARRLLLRDERSAV